MKIQKIFAVAFSLTMLFSLLPVGVAGVAAQSGGNQLPLTSRGETTFTATVRASQEVAGTASVKSLFGNSYEREIPRSAGLFAAPSAPSLKTPVAPSFKVVKKTPDGVTGWNGLSHADQRLANNGNQFSLEPPDQGLCAGGGFVLEAVNLAMTVYDTRGNVQKGVTDLNTFFGYPPAIDRVTGLFGPFISDPKCMYDSVGKRWFLTILVIEQDTAGNFSGQTHVDIAVSQTANPTGRWNLYALDTTEGDGTLPNHPGCPCFGDQPLIGFNPDAFIVSTNEFSVLGTEFNGAQIYAMPIRLLEKGKPAFAIHFDNLSLAEGQAYSVQPAFPNSKSAFDQQSDSQKRGGVEYFLSALEFTGGLDNRIALWALTGTDSLRSNRPNLSLKYVVLKSEVYGFPPAVDQKAGSFTLGQSLNEPENRIESNDDRMNQVQLADGLLYSGLNTILNVGGEDKAGIAYFVVDPNVHGKQPSGKIVHQGYVAVKNNNVVFPSIAVSNNGAALMTFSLSGQDYFPSAAFTTLGSRTMFVVGAGAEPADGFTGYAAFGGNGIERWGDYSAAATDGDHVWMATEYIPGGFRTVNANWGTFVFAVEH